MESEREDLRFIINAAYGYELRGPHAFKTKDRYDTPEKLKLDHMYTLVQGRGDREEVIVGCGVARVEEGTVHIGPIAVKKEMQAGLVSNSTIESPIGIWPLNQFAYFCSSKRAQIYPPPKPGPLPMYSM